MTDQMNESVKEGHTPGPWRVDVNSSPKWSVDYDGPSSSYVTISGGRREPVAFAVEPSAWGEAVDANARLIAAAPELFDSLDPDTLEAIADEITEGEGAFKHSARAASLRGIAKRQRAAIAKATAQ